ncbi:hypothetical protein CTI14_32720 [Methylobacterium radiotolerans]|nr:hypothetical protein CTI14_32720 [Methylobacterium radiotolerans]
MATDVQRVQSQFLRQRREQLRELRAEPRAQQHQVHFQGLHGAGALVFQGEQHAVSAVAGVHDVGHGEHVAVALTGDDPLVSQAVQLVQQGRATPP